MTELELQELVNELQSGNEKGLDKVFLSSYSACKAQLTKLTQSEADAEDLFMDAFWVLRGQLLQGKVQNALNLNGYLFTIARNLWLKQQQKEQRMVKASVDEKDVADFLTKISNNLEEQDEFELEGASEKEQNINAIVKAFGNLGEQCKKLLEGYLINNIPLKDLQTILGYNNYDTIRAAKYQCKKTLIDKFNKLQKRH